LSKPVSPYTRFTGLKNDFAAQMNLAEGTPFIIGGSDGCLAQWGCGAMRPGEMSVTIGTSAAVRMASASHQYDPKGRIFNYRLDEENYVAGGATNNGAVLLSWFAENVEHVVPDSDAFIREAFSVGSSEGLIFLPYVLGERAPIYDPHARGVFFGIGVNHTRAHFKRAMLEGICWSLSTIRDALEEVVHPVSRIVASGGFVQSDEWVQLLADILGRPVDVDSRNDASALGAALTGFRALGVEAKFPRGTGKRFLPDPERAGYYRKLIEIVESLYDKLKGDFEKLHNLDYFVLPKS
jgi:gluconokinase